MSARQKRMRLSPLEVNLEAGFEIVLNQPENHERPYVGTQGTGANISYSTNHKSFNSQQ